MPAWPPVAGTAQALSCRSSQNLDQQLPCCRQQRQAQARAAVLPACPGPRRTPAAAPNPMLAAPNTQARDLACEEGAGRAARHLAGAKRCTPAMLACPGQGGRPSSVHAGMPQPPRHQLCPSCSAARPDRCAHECGPGLSYEGPQPRRPRSPPRGSCHLQQAGKSGKGPAGWQTDRRGGSLREALIRGPGGRTFPGRYKTAGGCMVPPGKPGIQCPWLCGATTVGPAGPTRLGAQLCCKPQARHAGPGRSLKVGSPPELRSCLMSRWMPGMPV